MQSRPACDSGLVPIGTVANVVLPSFGITKRRLKQVESIVLIREQRASGHQELAFNARPFVLCGLPLRRPSSTELVHRRRNGKFFLHVVAHPDFGLPFGQDRLIPIWVATLALRQKSREVHFDSAAQMLDFFHLPKDGPHYRRLLEGFKRIFAATIFFGTEEQPESASVINRARCHFFDRMKLWFDSDHQCVPPSATHDNVVLLSEAFYREIDEHRIPVEREVVSALAHAPGVLDFYLWLAWKSWAAKDAPSRILIIGPGGLCDQLGAVQYSAPRRFRHLIVEWLEKVKVYWPACPAVATKDRRFLIVRSSRTSPAVRLVGSGTVK